MVRVGVPGPPSLTRIVLDYEQAPLSANDVDLSLAVDRDRRSRGVGAGPSVGVSDERYDNDEIRVAVASANANAGIRSDPSGSGKTTRSRVITHGTKRRSFGLGDPRSASSHSSRIASSAVALIPSPSIGTPTHLIPVEAAPVSTPGYATTHQH